MPDKKKKREEELRRQQEGKRKRSFDDEVAGVGLLQEPIEGSHVTPGDLKPDPTRVRPEDAVAGEKRNFWDITPRR